MKLFDAFKKSSGVKNTYNTIDMNTITEVVYTDNEHFGKVYARVVYSKIMHDCADRAMLPKEIVKDEYIITNHDSYSPYKRGLVMWIVEAMLACEQIFIEKELIQGTTNVYIFTKVDDAVREQIRQNPEEIPANVIELDFREFYEAKVIMALFELLKALLDAISKGVTVSGALLIKIHALSELIANQQNMEPLLQQIQQINDGLTQGKGAYVDAQSAIELPTYNSQPMQEAAGFVFSLISGITGYPMSDLFGEVVSSIGGGDSGDARRENAAIRRYFNSIYAPIAYNVFNRVFQYRQMVDDINGLISMFNFIETTNLLTEAGKLKFMINNTAMSEEDFAIDPTAEEQSADENGDLNGNDNQPVQ